MVSLADGPALERALNQPVNGEDASVDVDTLPVSAKEDKPEAHEDKVEKPAVVKESLNKETVATAEPLNDEAANVPMLDDETKATVVPAEAPAASKDAPPTPAVIAIAEPELLEETITAAEPEVPSSPVTSKVQVVSEPVSLVAAQADKEEPPKASEEVVETFPALKGDEPESKLPNGSANDNATEPEPSAVDDAPLIALTDAKTEPSVESSTEFASEIPAPQSAEQPDLIPKDAELPPANVEEDVKETPAVEPALVHVEPVSTEVKNAALQPEPVEKPTVSHDEDPVPTQPEATAPPADKEETQQPASATVEKPAVEHVSLTASTVDVPVQQNDDVDVVKTPEPEVPTPIVAETPAVEVEEAKPLAEEEPAASHVEVAAPVAEQEKTPEEPHDTPGVQAEAVVEPVKADREEIQEPIAAKEEEAVKPDVAEVQEDGPIVSTQDEQKEEAVSAPEPQALQEVAPEPSITASSEEPIKETPISEPEVPKAAEGPVAEPAKEESTTQPEIQPTVEGVHEQEASSEPAEASVAKEQEPVEETPAPKQQEPVEPQVPKEQPSVEEALTPQTAEASVEQDKVVQEEASAPVEEPVGQVEAATLDKHEPEQPKQEPEPVAALGEVKDLPSTPSEEPATIPAPPAEAESEPVNKDGEPESVASQDATPAVQEEPAHVSEPAPAEQDTPHEAPVAEDPIAPTPVSEPTLIAPEVAVPEPIHAEASTPIVNEFVQQETAKEDTVEVQADEVEGASLATTQVDVAAQNEASEDNKSTVVEPAPSADVPSAEADTPEPAPTKGTETPIIVTEDTDDSPAPLTVDTETVQKASEIERPKSPWTPSYTVTNQGPGVAEETAEVTEQAAVEVEPSPPKIETAVAAEDSLPASDAPKSPNWTPSYSVSQQGSPMPLTRELEPIEPEETPSSETREQVAEPLSPPEESKVPVVEEPKVENGVETHEEHSISTPVLQLPEDAPEELEEQQTKAPKEPEAQVNALNDDGHPAPVQNGADEAPKSPTWTPSYSVSRQGSPLLAPKELEAQESISVNGIESTSTVDEQPAVAPAPTEPALQLPEVSKEIERPGSPWTPSYSVTNQGPDTEEPQAEAAVEEAIPELPVLNLPPADEKLVDVAAIERPSSPWTPSYSVTQQAPERKVEEDVEPSTATPILQVETSAEPQESVSEPSADASEKLQSASPNWTPSYSVSRQGSPMLESQELPTVSEPEAPSQPAEQDDFIMPQTLMAAEPKADVPPVQPEPEQAQPKLEAAHLSPANEEPERPASPWTPSYSVSRQGSPLVQPKELEPSDDKAQVTEPPQIVVEEQSPTLETAAADTPKSPSWTPSYSVSQQGASSSAEEGLDKLEQLPNLKSTESFPESDKTRPPVLQLDTQAPPAPEAISPRTRNESTSSSRFFPGGWFSSSPKVPDEGRTSLDNALGEITPARPHAVEESPSKSRCFIM